MTRDLNKHEKIRKKLPIRPMKLAIPPMKLPGKVVKIPVSKIHVDMISSEMSEAVVAYFDILGFSQKKKHKDMETSLLDFSGALLLAAENYPEIRFNVFSDCAFISASLKDAADLLSAIRYAFTQWVSDGILVRGGIALGSYRETDARAHIVLRKALKNFVGNLFSGSAVTAAVRLEGSGCGGLLFTNEECAEFYAQKYGEPIFQLDDYKIIGWSDESRILYWFVGISFFQLLKLLSLKDESKRRTRKNLINNIRYSFTATNSLLPNILILTILSLPTIPFEAREKAVKLFKIKDPGDFNHFKEIIDELLKDEQKIKLLKTLADMDSSIPRLEE